MYFYRVDNIYLKTLCPLKIVDSMMTKIILLNENSNSRYADIFVSLMFRRFQFHDVFNLDNENRADDMPTLIDRKVYLICVITYFHISLFIRGVVAGYKCK